MTTARDADPARGLSLAPLRGLRPAVLPERLGRLLCPPYDVIDARTKRELLAADPDNAVSVVLPDPTAAGYRAAAHQLEALVRDGVYAVDDQPAVYVYEMHDPVGHPTRGLLGAVELRDAEDGVILPHENTMAGPVADRLALMTATDSDLEPIYLVYDGGGAASQLVSAADAAPVVAEAQTPDGVRHRLWAISDSDALTAMAADLDTRRAMIADGHHRYATYQERKRVRGSKQGSGPWDRGLALVVDSSEYGPQVHAIHRVVAGMPLGQAVEALDGKAVVERVDASSGDALVTLVDAPGFAAVLTDGAEAYCVVDSRGTLAKLSQRPGELAALAELDVTVVHRGLVEQVWGLADDVDTVRYAHSIDEATSLARELGGFALLLRSTPVTAVAAVAAAGGRMPRKSTLFTPKPASGMVMRRLRDQQ